MYIAFIDLDDTRKIVIRQEIHGLPLRGVPFEIVGEEEFFPGLYTVAFFESIMFSELDPMSEQEPPKGKAFVGVFLQKFEPAEEFDLQEWEYEYDDLSSIMDDDED